MCGQVDKARQGQRLYCEKLTKRISRFFPDPKLMISRGEEDMGPLLCEQLQSCLNDFVVVRNVPSNYDAVFNVLCVGETVAPASSDDLDDSKGQAKKTWTRVKTLWI